MRYVIRLIAIACSGLASLAIGPFDPARAAVPLTPADEGALKPGDSFRECDACPEMVVVPAGSFVMGSLSEEGRRPTEGPLHPVTIARAFAVGKFEVTFDEWDACVAAGGCLHRPRDEGWGRGRHPVINVAWDDVTRQYLPWLSQRTGKAYRLPTEAEWEYAARGVTSDLTPNRPYWWGDTASHEYANYGRDRCCEGLMHGRDRWLKTAPVGQFGANPFGLHDMHGNVWEWVQDCWNGTYLGAPPDGSAWTTGDCYSRIMRGGSWSSSPQNIRSADRLKGEHHGRYYNIGFRVARAI